MSSSGASSSNLRPANTKDPAWKYGEYKSITEKHIVKCLLCNHLCSGGITRLKEHILHSSGANAKPCPKTTPEIKKEIELFMNKKSENKCRRETFYFEDFARDIGDEQPHIGDDDVIEIGGPSLRPPPSLKRKKNTRGPMNLFCRGNIEDVVDQRLRGGSRQTTLEGRLKKEERKNAIQKIAKWAITAGVSFHALTSRSFHVALEAVGRFGSGLAPPSMHELGETCLQEEVRETHKILETHKGHWKTYGCTLMCDGWTDRRQRSLINFLANSPKGTMFLKSIDASAYSHTAIYLFNEISDVIENIIGKENVVQIVTDNAANYKAACELVIEKHPTIFWTPCAAHCIDLILEDIGKMHIRTISLARRITVFIYAHTQLLHVMRMFCNGDIVRPGPTRFATSFLTLQSLWEHKNAFRTLMVADEWTKSKWCNLRTGKQTERTILSVQFWKGVQRALHAGIPLVHVLRLVDGDEKPSMGYLYNAMDRAKEKIKENYQYRPLQYSPVLEVIEGRWSRQMSSDLYHAGFVFNPGVWFKTADRDAAVQTHMLRCVQAMAKMEPDPEVQDRLQRQLDYYLQESGPFSWGTIVRARDNTIPVNWWDKYGGEVPELRKVAIKILGLTCSSSGCERNWSAFENLHTKKRNRLKQKKLNDLVFVQYNQKLHERFLNLQRNPAHEDPINLDSLEDDNEWIMDVDGPVFEGEALTWTQVKHEAYGDTIEHQRPRRSTQQTHQSQGARRRGKQPIIEEPEDEDDDNDEEDEIIPALWVCSFTKPEEYGILSKNILVIEGTSQFQGIAS